MRQGRPKDQCEALCTSVLHAVGVHKRCTLRARWERASMRVCNLHVESKLLYRHDERPTREDIRDSYEVGSAVSCQGHPKDRRAR